MKILFWFNGSGGYRRDRKLMDYPGINDKNINKQVKLDRIEDDLAEWKDRLDSHSEYQRWGWTDNYNDKLDPVEKKELTYEI